ncbi:MAG: PQQ-binding-like beta-propeller repeat protein [Candidatus Fermentibacteraceae bacterium]|nr:PQQ-binding-like beta-propeller repeat protein [Candidatus Fermentibacteraceae bacterium]MBN2608386.1 PQQ-binding-like beta-propeller repeat protein [Candidatus Fermentibacteraceae bacterium]
MRTDTPVPISGAPSIRVPLLLALVMLAVGTGYADDPFGEQTYPVTIQTADRLALIEPSTTLEVALDGEAADLLEFIAPDLLLAGVVVVDGNSAPDYGPVYLIDTSTGEVKWEYDRDDLSGGSYSLLFSDPLIVLLGVDESSAGLIALNPESGRKVWDEKVDTPYGLAGIADRNQLYLTFRDGSDFRSLVLDLATGDEVMEIDLPSEAFSDIPHISVFVEDATAFLIGRSIVEVDLADGNIVRTVENPVSNPDPASTIFLADGILAWDAQEIAYIDRTSNDELWTVAPGNGPIIAAAVSNGHIVLISGTGQSTLSLLDPATGRQLWSNPVAGRIVSPIAAGNDLLLCTTDSTVVGVSAADGRTAFITPLPPDMASGSPTFAEIMGLPDVLRTEDGVLFVARERSGIAAFDLPDGLLRWYQAHYSAGIPLINYTADGRYGSVYLTMIETGQLSAGDPFTPPPSLSAANPDGTSRLLTVAQQRYDQARARYEAGQGSALDVEIASGGELVALQMDMFSGQLMAGMELAQSIMNFGAALRELRLAQGRQGVVDRMELALQGAQRAQENLFQSGYYLRPFYMEMWGRGVTIVETATGLRRDIIFSPQSPPALAYGLDMPTFAIESDRLVAFGISLQTDRYQRRSKWGTHIPDYSLLQYELGRMEFFSHPTFYPSLEPAITSRDIEQINWLIDHGRGAGILEWRNQAGETPIFFAVVMGMPDIVELLINAGADVNVVCDAGMTPIEMAGFSLETFDVLLAAGARTASGEIPSRPEDAVPPLLMAVCSNQIAEVQRLIESGEDVDWRGDNGLTVLFIAVAIGDPELVRVLLDCGADVNTVSTDGQTPLDLALTEEIRAILIAAGARSGNSAGE